MIADFGVAHGLSSAALRYFNAAGADPAGDIGECHDPESHRIPLALQALTGGRPLTLFGDDYPTPDGTCIRDYVHVSDLADAHVLALERLLPGPASLALNLGIGRGFSVSEVLSSINRVTGREVPHTVGPRRDGDPPVLVASVTRAFQELDWKPRFADLDQIVATAWSWHQRSGPAPVKQVATEAR